MQRDPRRPPGSTHAGRLWITAALALPIAAWAATAKAPTGKQIFRDDTFGNETFWTDTLRRHEAIATSVDPKTAL